VEDHSADRLKGAASAGKTTLIFAGGSSLDVKNHVQVARYVVRRVAEELTNALVLPITAEPIPSEADRMRRGAIG
jgi:hypothetical protein